MEKGNEKKTMGKEELDIAYQNKDITSKILAEEFKGKSFAVYGVDIPKIVSVEPTNLPAIEANELRMDNLFLLEDGSYLLVDYESVYDEANKVKYLGYVVRVSQRLYNKFKSYPKIRMLVIYTADVKRGSTNPMLDVGCNKFEITEAFLSEISSSEVWNTISRHMASGAGIDSKEAMELIIYPLTFSAMEDKQRVVGDVISLIDKLQNEELKRFVLKYLLVFTDKIIKDEDANRIKEELMLTKVEKLIYQEERERIAKNLLKDGYDLEMVIKNTGLSADAVSKLAEAIDKGQELVEN